MTKRSPFRDRASRGGCILAVVSYPVQVCGIHEPEKIGTIPETGVGLKTRKNPRERIEVATGRENQGEGRSVF